jgi:hypothetical protein
MAPLCCDYWKVCPFLDMLKNNLVSCTVVKLNARDVTILQLKHRINEGCFTMKCANINACGMQKPA